MRRFIALTLVLTLIVSSLIMPSYANVVVNDVSGHWAEETFTRWIDDGLISGYGNKTFKPDESITRAEFYTLINNVISLEVVEGIPFKDVSVNDWFSDTVVSAYENGLTGGYPDGSFKPLNPITREEVAVVVAKMMGYPIVENISLLNNFSDSSESDNWNESSVESLLEKGLISGYSNNTLRLNNNITRAEVVVLLDKIFGEKYYESGIYGGNTSEEIITIQGNVTINSADVTLKNMIIMGDIYIAESVGDGEVYLDNVIIAGDTIIKGGGENSIYFNNVLIEGTLVVNKLDDEIRIVASGNTEIKITVLESGVTLVEEELVGGGFKAVEIPSNDDVDLKIILCGNFESVTVEAADIKIEVDENSVIAEFKASETAGNLELIGKGTIENVEIKADHVSVEVEYESISVEAGVEGTVVDGDDVQGGQSLKESVATNKKSSGGSDNSSSSEPAEEQEWTLTWSDEFSGTEIDRTKWDYDIGNWIVDEEGNGVSAGWGNNEKEYYTDSSENSYIQDGHLVIEAREEETTDEFGTYDYTSAKLKSKGLFSKKYGRYEISAKLPVGSGLWPAIWMMPADDVYGGWAASGEIDIVEGWGSRPDTVGGTLHYGALWPNNKYTGDEYVFPEGSSVNEFHDYVIEWEPGAIRWYVDGEHYQTQDNWSTTDGNGEKYAFPAPFDQEFYFILNLAVGGWFDGDPTDETEFPSTMEVDYVRVYELTGRDYMTAIQPDIVGETLPEDAKAADSEGNLLSNGDFAEIIQDNPQAALEFSDKWNLLNLSDFGGNASQSIDIIDNTNFAKIDISNGGSQSYSVQLVQLTTLGTGRYYTLSFDAKANASRSISMKMGGGEDAGWAVYSDNYAIDLTDSVQHFEKTFQMAADTDVNARLEFNMGLDTNSVWLGNVKLEEVDAPNVDYDATKSPLPDGNGIYNGKFDKESIDRMAYWNFSTDGADANASVMETTRELFVDINNEGPDTDTITLNQKGIQLEQNNQYKFSMMARSSTPRNIEVGLISKDGTIDYSSIETIETTTEMALYDFDFKMNEATDLESQIIFNLGGSEGDVYLDDLSLEITSIDYSSIDVFPLGNGDFSDGLTSWNNYVDGSAVADIVVENEELKVQVGSVGPETWGIQLYQGSFDFSKSVEYIVGFDVKSTLDRNLEVVVDNSSYNRYLSETVAASSEYTHYEFVFKVDVDDTVSLKFLLGKTDGSVPVGAHDIYIDNVVCEVKDAPKDTNLIIKNGIFDTDTENWNVYTNDGSNASVSVTDGELKIDFPGYAGWFKWSTQVYQNIIALEAGKTYELSFDARSTVAKDVWFEMTDMSEQVLTLTDSMETFTYEFTASETITDGTLNFLLGTENMDGADFVAGQSVFLDNITITEIVDISEPEDDGIIINNGTFDIDVDGWLTYTADGSSAAFTTTGGALQIEFSNYPGWNTWSTQFYQDTIELEEGKTYELTFDASSTAARDAVIEMSNMNAQVLTLTDSIQTFSYEFTATETISNGKLNFLLGSENIAGELFTTSESIYLDNIVIIEK